MPWLIAVRVVSLPATARRMKNGAISLSASMSPSTSLWTSFEVRSSVGFFRRSSARSFINWLSCMPAPNIAIIGSPSPMNSGSPPLRITFVASRTVLNSLRGMPIMSQITSSGNGCDSTWTRSTSPRSQKPSITSEQIVSTESSTLCRSVGENVRPTIARWRAWRGLSMLMNEPKNSSACSGRSGIDTAPLPEQKSFGRFVISTTSA